MGRLSWKQPHPYFTRTDSGMAAFLGRRHDEDGRKEGKGWERVRGEAWLQGEVWGAWWFRLDDYLF